MISVAKLEHSRVRDKHVWLTAAESDEKPIWRANRLFVGIKIRVFVFSSRMVRDEKVAKSGYSGRITISMRLPSMSSCAAALTFSGVSAFTADS